MILEMALTSTISSPFPLQSKLTSLAQRASSSCPASLSTGTDSTLQPLLPHRYTSLSATVRASALTLRRRCRPHSTPLQSVPSLSSPTPLCPLMSPLVLCLSLLSPSNTSPPHPFVPSPPSAPPCSASPFDPSVVVSCSSPGFRLDSQSLYSHYTDAPDPCSFFSVVTILIPRQTDAVTITRKRSTAVLPQRRRKSLPRSASCPVSHHTRISPPISCTSPNLHDSVCPQLAFSCLVPQTTCASSIPIPPRDSH